MSLTLPYASAVNCQFVALPDSLATDDNTLKLYNIDGGGGGGTTDAYTKEESDARYLKLVAATAQTVTQIPVFASGIKSALDIIAATSTNLTKHVRFYAAPSTLRGEIYDNGTGICYQGNQVSVMTVNASDAILASVRVAGNVIILAKYNGNLYKVWVPALASDNVDFVITNPSTAQTINKDLTIAGSLITQTLKFSSTPTASFNTSTNGITVAQETTTGTVPSSSAVCNWTKNYAIPKTDIVTTVTGVSDNKVPSEWAVKRYVDANGSANAILKTDLVTTVTGDSDSKVPSEKAVKTYVDSLGNNSYVSIIHQYSPSYPVPENYLQRLGFSQFTLHVENIGTLDQTVPLFSWACPLNRNIRIKIEGNSYRVTANDVIQTLITKNFYQHSFVANTTPYQVLASGNYTVYDTTKDYPMFVSDMVNNRLICNFRAFVPVTYSTFTISIWVTDIY